MTTSQWNNISEAVKKQITKPCFVWREARQWCKVNGIELKEFKTAVDSRKWHFVCHVVECVGFSQEIFQKLKQVNDGGEGEQ